MLANRRSWSKPKATIHLLPLPLQFAASLAKSNRMVPWLEQPAARELTLALRVRTRSVGGWPWLGLVAWALVARAQEPQLLRSFGVDIAEMAIWSGGTVVLFSLLSVAAANPASRIQLRRAVTEAAILVLAVALIQACLTGLMELIFARSIRLGTLANSAWTFLLVWLAPATAWIPPARTIPDHGVRIGVLLVSLSFAGAVHRNGLGICLAAAVLAMTGALLFVWGRACAPPA